MPLSVAPGRQRVEDAVQVVDVHVRHLVAADVVGVEQEVRVVEVHRLVEEVHVDAGVALVVDVDAEELVVLEEVQLGAVLEAVGDRALQRGRVVGLLVVIVVLVERFVQEHGLRIDVERGVLLDEILAQVDRIIRVHGAPGRDRSAGCSRSRAAGRSPCSVPEGLTPV